MIDYLKDRTVRHHTALAIFFFVLLSACAKEDTMIFKKTEIIMGTEVSVTVVARSAEEGEKAIDAALEEVRRLDRMMSLYKDDNEITKINMAAGRKPVRVSPEIIEVVEAAERVSRLTRGAFDITVGPLVVLWQMRLKEGRVPSQKEIEAVMPRVGYRNIKIDRHKSEIFLEKPGMIIDLGGVAKGYAADRAASVLAGHGIRDAVIAIAGDIRVMGRRPGGEPWRIGIQHPREKDRLLGVLNLSDISVSTSGGYERFMIVGKERYHHIIDPRTGMPAEGMESVTIIGSEGAIIDPLTTALFILGQKEGMNLVKKLGYEAVFVDSNGTVLSTEGIKLN